MYSHCGFEHTQLAAGVFDFALHTHSLGADVALAIGAMLSVSTLTSVDLSSNNLGREGGEAVAQAVQRGSALTSLRLERCYIGREAVAALARALDVNTTLEELDARYSLERWKAEDEAAAQQMAAVVLSHKALLKFGGVPMRELRANELAELDLSKQGLGLAEGLVPGGVMAGATALLKVTSPHLPSPAPHRVAFAVSLTLFRSQLHDVTQRRRVTCRVRHRFVWAKISWATKVRHRSVRPCGRPSCSCWI